MTELVHVETADGVTTVTLARPEKRNALTLAMYDRVAEALGAADRDPDVRAVILSGGPGIFTAGNDLGDFLERRPARIGPLSPFMEAVLDFEKPLIAAVTGHAVGIGVTLLLHCDLVYVAEDARLSLPFVALGLVPEFGSSLLLPRLMGAARANEKLLLGEPIGALEAVSIGLATKALPADQVVAAARAAAAKLRSLPPEALRETKRLLRAPLRDRVREVAGAESRVLFERLESPEAGAALRAFLARVRR